MLSRRHFIEGLGVWGLTGCATNPPPALRPMPAPPPAGPDLQVGTSSMTLEQVLGRALDTAKRAGASYADARIHKRRHERLVAREDHLVSVDSSETYGIGVRVLVERRVGFASSRRRPKPMPTRQRAARWRVARANAGPRKRPIVLAPTETHRDKWQTRLAGRSVQGPARRQGGARAFDLARGQESRRRHVLHRPRARRSTSGSCCDHRRLVHRAAHRARRRRLHGDRQRRQARRVRDARRTESPPMQAGWEYVDAAALLAEIRAQDRRRRGREAQGTARSRRQARPDPRARHLWLTIHEIDRAPDRARSRARLRGELRRHVVRDARQARQAPLRRATLTFYADKTTPGGLATCGYDDDGVRTAALGPRRKTACSSATRPRASRPAGSARRPRAAPATPRITARSPFQRMPNVSLAPARRSDARRHHRRDRRRRADHRRRLVVDRSPAL